MPSRHEPLAEIIRGTAKQKIVGRPGVSVPLPRQAYGTPKDVAPSHGSKHRRVRYLEDFVADGSGNAEIHDLVAGGITKATGVDALRLLSAAGRDGRIEDAGFTNKNRDPWAKAKIFCAQAELIPPATADEATPVKPATPRRELLQRTSKRQRLLMKAFRLQQSGAAWDDIAKALSIPRSEVRSMQRLVTSMLGRAVAKRPREQKRDGVGCFAKAETKRKPNQTAGNLQVRNAA
jgi:hypothetical protein